MGVSEICFSKHTGWMFLESHKGKAFLTAETVDTDAHCLKSSFPHVFLQQVVRKNRPQPLERSVREMKVYAGKTHLTEKPGKEGPRYRQHPGRRPLRGPDPLALAPAPGHAPESKCLVFRSLFFFFFSLEKTHINDFTIALKTNLLRLRKSSSKRKPN